MTNEDEFRDIEGPHLLEGGQDAKYSGTQRCVCDSKCSILSTRN
jgi:hypothetical protein